MKKRTQKEIVEEWAEDLNEAVAAELWDFPYNYDPSNFSDVSDPQGNYYVDLVLGGGGMLGIAHAGFIHALEESKLRFRAVAGSSAGALSAALLMGQAQKKEWKGLTLGASLASIDGHQLLDNWRARLIFKWKFKWKLPFAWLLTVIVPDLLLGRRGLISGKKFQKKLEETLAELGEKSGNESDRQPNGDAGFLRNFEKLAIRHSDRKEIVDDLIDPKLILIASDISTETKLMLPDDEKLFDLGSDTSVPLYVRASTAVPGFFEPVKMKLKKPLARKKYRESDSECLALNWVFLVDGGLMSNFPISVFHKKSKLSTPEVPAGFISPPRLPTFGVKLIPMAKVRNRTFLPCQYISALVSTMYDLADEEFLEQHPDYGLITSQIDVSHLHPFNLYLKKCEKIDLFVRGYRKGKEFLEKFDWHEYKKLRHKIACEESVC